MKFESKFNFGDKVYSIIKSRKKVWIPCEFCDSIGEIKGKNKAKRMCPCCYGNKGSCGYKELKWAVELGLLTIRQIRVHATDKIFCQGDFTEKEREVRYMCTETGVGSGTLHDELQLFKTKKTAQKECDKLNKGE